jgi:hypothetical protein
MDFIALEYVNIYHVYLFLYLLTCLSSIYLSVILSLSSFTIHFPDDCEETEKVNTKIKVKGSIWTPHGQQGA